MAFRKSALEAIGGFDRQFRSAGDDVDVCWRLQARGWTLGFCPSAVVWHHRRNSVAAYWRQQKDMKSRGALEAKWPEKYNSAGHHTFEGRLYGKGFSHILGSKTRIYHGLLGSAPFQRLYEPSMKTLRVLPIMPEWYLADLLGFSLLCTGALVETVAGRCPIHHCCDADSDSSLEKCGSRFSVHAAWLVGGAAAARPRSLPFCTCFSPWRGCPDVSSTVSFSGDGGALGFAFPWIRTFAFWTKKWMAPEKRLTWVERWLRRRSKRLLPWP